MDTDGRDQRSGGVLRDRKCHRVYEERGELRDADLRLARILEKYGENRTLRAMIRFKLRDIYNQTDQHEKALQQLEEVIAESVQ